MQLSWKRIGVMTLPLFVALPLFALPPFYPDKAQLMEYRDSSGKIFPIRSAEEWPIRRRHILENMQEVMGPLPDKTHERPTDCTIMETVDNAKWRRMKLSYLADDNDSVPAYLFIPKEVKRYPIGNTRKPAVLCLHQTTRIGKSEPAGIGGDPNLHYAKELADLGYVTLAPDYPQYGDSKFSPYESGYVSSTMKGIRNHMRAVDFLSSRSDVDRNRIGVIGHSLGGHNSLFVAAFDERIRCIVSNCGFCSFPRYYKGNLAGWSHNGYMPRIRSVYELKPEKMPFDFTEVVAALAPRPFLAIAPIRDDNFDVQGVKDCITAALPVYELLGAKENLSAHYPDCAHQFPPEARKIAYDWIGRWLKK